MCHTTNSVNLVSMELRPPRAKVAATRVIFEAKQIIGFDHDPLAQFAFLLRDLLERGHLLHLGMREKLTGNGRWRKRQPFLQYTANTSLE